MRRTSILLHGLFAMLIASACSGGSTEPGTISLSGTYSGTINAVGFPAGTLTFTLSHAGTSVTGTWSNSLGASGNGTGTVSGTTLTFTLSQTSPCTGTFTGNAAIQNSGARLSGSFSGSDCNGSGSGTFVVNR